LFLLFSFTWVSRHDTPCSDGPTWHFRVPTPLEWVSRHDAPCSDGPTWHLRVPTPLEWVSRHDAPCSDGPTWHFHVPTPWDPVLLGPVARIHFLPVRKAISMVGPTDLPIWADTVKASWGGRPFPKSLGARPKRPLLSGQRLAGTVLLSALVDRTVLLSALVGRTIC